MSEYLNKTFGRIRDVCRERDAEVKAAAKAAAEAPPLAIGQAPQPEPPVGFDAAYMRIKSVGLGQSCSAAEAAENAVKNRYLNVLAYDHSRVMLKAGAPGGTDYINANWIGGLRRPRAYIASQAPVPASFDDFWWMIWHENIQLVAMVTREVEKGVLKCHRYWPDGDIGASQSYGSITVTLTAVEPKDTFTQRHFAIALGDAKPRTIMQLCFDSWPDHGVPLTTAEFLSFRDQINTEWSKHPASPLLVHCSAGVGRTGTYIAVDRVLNEIAANAPSIDIDRTCSDLRRCRTNMIQTITQYLFVWRVIIDAVKSLMAGGSFTNTPGLPAEPEKSKVSFTNKPMVAPTAEREEEKITAIEQEQEDEASEVKELMKGATLKRVKVAPVELAEAERKWDADASHTYELTTNLTTVESRFEALQSMGVDIQLAAVEHITRLVREAKLGRAKKEEEAAEIAAREAEAVAKAEEAIVASQRQEEKSKARRRASDQANKYLRKLSSGQ